MMEEVENLDELIFSVDNFRSREEWNEVKNGIEKIWTVLDSRSTVACKQYPELKTQRAYYFCCHAEYTFEFQKDFISAIEFIRKAIITDYNFFDTQIITSRILLKMCYPFFIEQNESSTKIHLEIINGINGRHCREFSSILGVVGETLQDFTDADKEILESIISSKGETFRTIILTILNSCTVSVGENSELFHNLIEEYNQQSDPEKLDTLFIHLVFTISRNLLEKTIIDFIAEKYEYQLVSDYRMWLLIDSFATKGILNELLNDPGQGKLDALEIVNNILPPYIDLQKFDTIPDICITQALLAVSRIPLIDLNLNAFEDSIESFERCISLDSPLYELLPLPLLIGLNVEASILHLKQARIEYVAEASNSSSNNYSRNVANESQTMKEIDIAYSFLTSIRHTLKTKENLTTTVINSSKQFLDNCQNSAPLSQVLLLPILSTDPRSIIPCASTGFIATLMAAITAFKCYEFEEYFREKDIVELFEWGLSFEIKPDLNLLWNLACSYIKVNKFDDAIVLLQQCQTMIKRQTKNNILAENNLTQNQTDTTQNLQSHIFPFQINSKNKKNLNSNNYFDLSKYYLYKDFSNILQWLGFEYQLTEHPWLASVKCVEVILGHKSTTELSKAFDVLKNTIIDLYPQIGKDVLLSVGSTIKDFHELNAICKKRVLNLFEFGVDEAKYKNNDEDLYPNNIQVNPDDVDEGLFKLLSLLGKCHVAWANQTSTCDYDKVLHYRVSTKIFQFLTDIDRFSFNTINNNNLNNSNLNNNNSYNNNNNSNQETPESETDKQQQQQSKNEKNRNIKTIEHRRFIYPRDDIELYHALSLTMLKEFESAMLIIRSTLEKRSQYENGDSIIDVNNTTIAANIDDNNNDDDDDSLADEEDKNLFQLNDNIREMNLKDANDSISNLLQNSNNINLFNNNISNNNNNNNKTINKQEKEKNTVNVNETTPLLHLLALIITLNNDDPNRIAAAVVICKLIYNKTIENLHENWNIQVTLFLLEWYAVGDKEELVLKLDKFMQLVYEEFEVNVNNVNNTKPRSNTLFNNNNNNNAANNTNVVRNLANEYNNNKNIVNNNDNNGDIEEKNDFESFNDKKNNIKNINKKITFYTTFKPSMKSNKKLICTLIITIGKLYRSCGYFSKAKNSFEEAFRILYMSTHNRETELKLSDIANGDSNEHKSIDTLRHLPTLLGWRLPEGCGWGAAHEYRDVEADILFECGEIIQIEEKNMCSIRAIELFQIAIATYSEHSQSLVALAKIELLKFENYLERNEIKILLKEAKKDKSNKNYHDKQKFNNNSKNLLNKEKDVDSKFVEELQLLNFDLRKFSKKHLQSTMFNNNNNKNNNINQQTNINNNDSHNASFSSSNNSDNNNNNNTSKSNRSNKKENNINSDYFEEKNDFAVDDDYTDEYTNAVINSKELVNAYHYCASALLAKELNPDAWFVLGKTLEYMGDKEHAIEALVTSIECEQNVPTRPFPVVLF